MPRRTRTAKKLAQRINLDYFVRPTPFGRWRRALSLAAVLLAAGWVGWLLASGNEAPFSSGPLAAAHAPLAGRCAACHVGRGFARPVADAACLACHTGPTHAQTQTASPACGACHAEHRSRPHLVAIDDGSCTRCHAALETAGGTLRVARSIRRFGATHPEFAAVRAGLDAGTLRFSHSAHLRPDLRGPQGVESLSCAACHEVISDRVTVGDMQPVRYQRHCARCHGLVVDERIGPVPHERPEIVRAFVQERLGEAVAAAARPPRQRRPADEAHPATAWSDVDRLLRRKTCAECHRIGGDAEALWTVEPPGIAERWFHAARFRHRAHLTVACATCHAATPSVVAADLLLPGRDVCGACHAAGGNASPRCQVCHYYHPENDRPRVLGVSH